MTVFIVDLTLRVRRLTRSVRSTMQPRGFFTATFRIL